MLWLTLALIITFINFQFQGFSEIISSGYYFTGAESSITTSFLYVLVLLHLAHVSAGLIVLSVVLINAYRNQYSSEQTLGVKLAELFWHFLDFLWLYLFLFVTIYQ
jgi:cytochrome c oxidase subunit 3